MDIPLILRAGDHTILPNNDSFLFEALQNLKTAARLYKLNIVVFIADESVSNCIPLIQSEDKSLKDIKRLMEDFDIENPKVATTITRSNGN